MNKSECGPLGGLLRNRTRSLQGFGSEQGAVALFSRSRGTHTSMTEAPLNLDLKHCIPCCCSTRLTDQSRGRLRAAWVRMVERITFHNDTDPSSSSFVGCFPQRAPWRRPSGCTYTASSTSAQRNVAISPWRVSGSVSDRSSVSAFTSGTKE